MKIAASTRLKMMWNSEVKRARSGSIASKPALIGPMNGRTRITPTSRLMRLPAGKR